MASTFTTWNGPSSLSRYVRAAIEGRETDAAALREEAYRDGSTWGEIDRALFEARLRHERERGDNLVRFVDAAIDASFSGPPAGRLFIDPVTGAHGWASPRGDA